MADKKQDKMKLRECPFCGSLDISVRRGQIAGPAPDNGIRFIYCNICGTSTSRRPELDAIVHWNTRVNAQNKE